ncbi:hypothetical protein B296_00005002 [Ensete ventricosum]|uniref:Uncharacterized protein n=1 Tax=Ensete ventricosum TaxID=4639 RepID=A0A427AGZ0_ENSVE|nr:hypothetical protein B296_00005002 [Ensete ventricosum]
MMTAAGICEEVQRRDIGTEMTPLGSSTATRCNTPIKSSSPARHNTPADRSGALVPCNTCIDISELSDCHFAKLKLSAQYDPIVPNWSSREEEEVEVSRSLRHLEMSSGRTTAAAAYLIEALAIAMADRAVWVIIYHWRRPLDVWCFKAYSVASEVKAQP